MHTASVVSVVLLSSSQCAVSGLSHCAAVLHGSPVLTQQNDIHDICVNNKGRLIMVFRMLGHEGQSVALSGRALIVAIYRRPRRLANPVYARGLLALGYPLHPGKSGPENHVSSA